MDYFKLIFRTGEEEFESKEIIIDENQHKEVQNQIIDGVDFIVIKEKATIKRSSIASISLANDIVEEYQKRGAHIEGMIEQPSKLKIQGGVQSLEEIANIKKENLKKWIKDNPWRQK